jgi:uncharacterized protein YceH (UPF0502 family)
MSEPESPRTWVPLSPRERRVLGVLVEKQKTTPEYYPMTIAAIVTGSNQKSNRDPVTNYDADDVEDTLQSLRRKGVTVLVEGSGRVPKWKHSAYEWLNLRSRPAEMAVLAELLLRGPQTEGDLRARASRMDDLPDLPALQAVLKNLSDQNLIVYLSPPGQRRGVVVTHGLYPPDELERVRSTSSSPSASCEDDDRPARPAPAPPGWTDEAAALRAEIEQLRQSMQSLAEDVRALKSALGD